ncbi:hypothetical protein BDR07DRAFT_1440068 [Suillus spraguei]|nr:hypothetical protein BDR07DRAFT_1440068 [Suillus spraguei]
MPFRKISRDVKLAAVKLHEQNILSLEQILDCVGFSEHTFWRMIKLWRETGDVVQHSYGAPGRPRTLILTIDNRFISVHYTTIYQELSRAGISHKKLKKIAKERNEAKRADFIRRMAQYEPEELGFLDETSKDERSLKGTCAVKKQVFVHGHRLSGLELLTIDGMVAISVVEGLFTAATFKTFIEEDVLPLCTPYPGKLSVLIMDNAKIHHGEGIAELICETEAFSKIKSFICRNQEYFSDDVNGIIYDMYIVMDMITGSDAEGYIMHAGYF